jgi:site-specific recombinase XerD
MVQRRSIQLRDAFSVFLVDRKARGFTPSTIVYYEQKLGAFITWAEKQGVKTVGNITPNAIRTYIVVLQERGQKVMTIIGSTRAIRAFCNFAVAEGWIDRSPMSTVPNPKPPKHILPAFAPEEVQRLLAAAPDTRTRALVLFLLDTGLRAAEVAKLNGADIDLQVGAVRVIEGKGRKDRTAYMGAKARRALVAYYAEAGWPAADGAVWRATRTGARLTDSGIRQALTDLGAAAKVEHCHPHTFRRTFALWALRAGMNIHVLARIMGHEDIQVLRQYLPFVEADLHAAHQAAAPVDRLLK